ncbi:MAG: hypothetical protein ACRC2V_14530, partial [Xenococcaceae cyanobacterium]
FRGNLGIALARREKEAAKNQTYAPSARSHSPVEVLPSAFSSAEALVNAIASETKTNSNAIVIKTLIFFSY